MSVPAARPLLALSCVLMVALPVTALPLDAAMSPGVPGNVKVVVIPLQFQDVKGVTPVASLQNLFFAEGAKERSVRTYWAEVSGGRVEFGGIVLDRWVTSQYDMAQYGNGRWTHGGHTDELEFVYPPLPSCAMATEAVRLADAFIDYSQFVDPLTGTVRVVVVHAGADENQHDLHDLDVWPHAWQLCDESGGSWGDIWADGVRFESYMTASELASLGIQVHELGHLSFGLPDLYGGNNDVRYWDLMASGSHDGTPLNEPLDAHANFPLGAEPSHLGAWSKIQLGWGDVATVLPSAAPAEWTLQPAEGAQGLAFLRLEVDTDACWTWQSAGAPWQLAWAQGDRYFLVEYRKTDAGDYDNARGRSGVVLWYVDECANGGSWWSANARAGEPRVRVVQPTSPAMRAGDYASQLSPWSTRIGDRATGWFVEVVETGQTAKVRVGNGAADILVMVPGNGNTVTASGRTAQVPAPAANVDEAHAELRTPSILRKDSDVWIQVAGAQSWSVALEGDTTHALACAGSAVKSCKVPAGAPSGDYVLRARASDGSVQRRVDLPVTLV